MILGTTYGNKWATVVFLYSMVYIINYLLKELLMAIILDEFSKFLVERERDNFHDTEADNAGDNEDLENKFVESSMN